MQNVYKEERFRHSCDRFCHSQDFHVSEALTTSKQWRSCRQLSCTTERPRAITEVPSPPSLRCSSHRDCLPGEWCSRTQITCCFAPFCTEFGTCRRLVCHFVRLLPRLFFRLLYHPGQCYNERDCFSQERCVKHSYCSSLPYRGLCIEVIHTGWPKINQPLLIFLTNSVYLTHF